MITRRGLLAGILGAGIAPEWNYLVQSGQSDEIFRMIMKDGKLRFNIVEA